MHLVIKKSGGQVNTKILTKLLNDPNSCAGVNYTTEYGDSPLLEACKLSQESNDVLEIVTLLINNKSDIKHANTYGQNALHIAAAYDNANLIELLYEKEKSLIKRKTGEEEHTPLHFAARYNSMNAVKYLVVRHRELLEATDYQGRTPFFLAAEYGYSNIVKLLLDMGSNCNVENKSGQKALYWVIAKCPDMAEQILNRYQVENRYQNVIEFELANLALDPKAIGNTKSILMYIVENEKLDIISHPVIQVLIKSKWKDFARTRCITDIILTVVKLVVWNLIADLQNYKTSYIYNLPQDWWRIFLWILGVLALIIGILIEVVELKNSYSHQDRSNKARQAELEVENRFCHPLDKRQRNFLKEEKKQCKTTRPLYAYFNDFWNIYDLLSTVFLLLVFFVHLADISNHTDEIAVVYSRIFSLAIIFISVDIFKIGRVINERFGTLVVSITFIFSKVFAWFALYCIVWLPYCSAFWMLFGASKYADSTTKNGVCGGISSPNCTYVNDADFPTYNKVMFKVWSNTFGRQFDLATMQSIDPIFSVLLVMTAIFLLSLMLLNIFIALLSSTMDRVRRKAKAYFLLQRATLIVTKEFQLSYKRRERHIQALREKKHLEKYNKDLIILNSDNDMSNEVMEVSKNVDDLNNRLNNLESNLLKSVSENLDEICNRENKKEHGASDKKFKKLMKEINQMKNLLSKKIK